MQQLQEIKNFPVSALKVGRPYQRSIDLSRMNNILFSIQKHGYLNSFVITTNQDFFIIDGQHRKLAAEKAGIESVPVSVMHCEDLQEEAELFNLLNSFNTKLKPLDAWHARYLVGHPIAKAVYLLNENEKSLVCERIALKGHDSEEYKLRIGDITLILNCCVLNLAKTWTYDADRGLCDRLSKKTDEEVLSECNQFFSWFFSCFGSDKKSNPIPYSRASMRPIVFFFLRLKRIGFFQLGRSQQTDAIKKMNSFVFTSDWQRVGDEARLNMLVSHWNKGRTKNKLTYSESEV